jgi:hypothetical protein
MSYYLYEPDTSWYKASPLTVRHWMEDLQRWSCTDQGDKMYGTAQGCFTEWFDGTTWQPRGPAYWLAMAAYIRIHNSHRRDWIVNCEHNALVEPEPKEKHSEDNHL